MFSNVVVSCPVGLRDTFPGSLTSTPEIGSSATRYIATSDSNGFSGGAPLSVLKFCGDAKYTAPFSGCAITGTSIVAFAIFEESGQKFTPGSNVASLRGSGALPPRPSRRDCRADTR